MDQIKQMQINQPTRNKPKIYTIHNLGLCYVIIEFKFIISFKVLFSI